jgi:hypothetical protein
MISRRVSSLQWSKIIHAWNLHIAVAWRYERELVGEVWSERKEELAERERKETE